MPVALLAYRSAQSELRRTESERRAVASAASGRVEWRGRGRSGWRLGTGQKALHKHSGSEPECRLEPA